MASVNITPSENGPYLVSGDVHLTDVDGREIPHPNPMALCRCGHSSNKPFCDGTHLKIGFDGRWPTNAMKVALTRKRSSKTSAWCFRRWENQGFNVKTMFPSDGNVAAFGDFRYKSSRTVSTTS